MWPQSFWMGYYYFSMKTFYIWNVVNMYLKWKNENTTILVKLTFLLWHVPKTFQKTMVILPASRNKCLLRKNDFKPQLPNEGLHFLWTKTVFSGIINNVISLTICHSPLHFLGRVQGGRWGSGPAIVYISSSSSPLAWLSEEKHFHKSGARYMCSQFPGSGH